MSFGNLIPIQQGGLSQGEIPERFLGGLAPLGMGISTLIVGIFLSSWNCLFLGGACFVVEFFLSAI